MTIKIGINGYGRIGRNIVRAYFENFSDSNLEIVAINDLGDPAALAHLTRYDTAHGRFGGTVELADNAMTINNHRIALFSIRSPEQLPWKELGVDIVFECTGIFTSQEKASLHLKAGAKKVLISAPASGAVDATVVYGVNHETILPEHTVISNASCTTNCLASIVAPLHKTFGVEQGFMTTVHSYTNDQVLCDVYHKDLRRARAAACSMIPTNTGAAKAVGLVIPELNGKLDGFSFRVPTLNVSIVDLTFIAKTPTTAEAVNQCLEQHSNNHTLAISHEPLVSCDFNHHPASAVFDTTLTKVSHTLVKVNAWYDNEWGFSNRMLDVARYSCS